MKNTNPAFTKSRYYPWVAVFIAALYYCYEYFLRIAPSVMVNELRQAFSIDAFLFGHMAAFYYYAYTPMQIPVGLLFDRFGVRWLLFSACLLCASGSLLFSQTHVLAMAELARFVMGFGSAFAFVGVLALANQWLSSRYFAFIAGLTTSLGMFGAMEGELILAKITEDLGWQTTMYYAGCVGFALSLVILFVIRDNPERERMSDTRNAVIQFAISLRRVLGITPVWISGIVGALLYLSLSVFAELWAVPFLQVAYSFSRIEAAQAVTMVYLGWALGGPLIGLISDKVNLRSLPLVIGSIFALVCILIVLYVPGLPIPLLYLSLFGYGLFCGAEVIIFAVSKESARPELAGTSVAVVNMITMLAGAVLQPWVGRMLDKFWTGEMIDNMRVYSLDHYQLALMVLPIGIGLAIFFCFALPRRGVKA